MGNASTRNAYSSSQQKVSSHSHGISKIEGLIVSTTPEPKVKQKRIREPDCHKKGGWVAIGTFVVTHPSEKVPILCNTRYIHMYMLSRIATDATTFEMELCGHKQATAQAYARPHCVWLNFEHTKKFESFKKNSAATRIEFESSN